MASHRSVAKSSRHTCFTSTPPPCATCRWFFPADNGQCFEKVLRPHAVRRLAHQYQAPRPDNPQVQGDEGPHLGEDGGTVSNPGGSCGWWGPPCRGMLCRNQSYKTMLWQCYGSIECPETKIRKFSRLSVCPCHRMPEKGAEQC